MAIANTQLASKEFAQKYTSRILYIFNLPLQMFSNVIFLVLIFNFTCYTLVDHIETRGEKEDKRNARSQIF